MPIIAEMISLFTVSITVVCAVNSLSGHYQENDRIPSRRFVLDDDYHTIINRLNNLTNEVGALKNEGEVLKNKVEALEKENCKLLIKYKCKETKGRRQ